MLILTWSACAAYFDNFVCVCVSVNLVDDAFKLATWRDSHDWCVDVLNVCVVFVVCICCMYLLYAHLKNRHNEVPCTY